MRKRRQIKDQMYLDLGKGLSTSLDNYRSYMVYFKEIAWKLKESSSVFLFSEEFYDSTLFGGLK